MTESVHQFLDIATPICLVALFVIQLMIKFAQEKSKNAIRDQQDAVKKDLGGQQSELKDSMVDLRERIIGKLNDTKVEVILGQSQLRHDMEAKHAENWLTFVAHAAEDKAEQAAVRGLIDERDKSTGRTLQRIDNTLNELRKDIKERSRKE